MRGEQDAPVGAGCHRVCLVASESAEALTPAEGAGACPPPVAGLADPACVRAGLSSGNDMIHAASGLLTIADLLEIAS